MLQFLDTDLIGVGDIIPIFVALVFEINCFFAIMATEQVHFLVFVACGDKLLQS